MTKDKLKVEYVKLCDEAGHLAAEQGAGSDGNGVADRDIHHRRKQLQQRMEAFFVEVLNHPEF